MKIDSYTKGILILIAATLLWVGVKDTFIADAKASQTVYCEIDEPLKVLVVGGRRENSPVKVVCVDC